MIADTLPPHNSNSHKTRSNDKRERLLLAARELLREKHFEDVTIPNIASVAEVAVGTFYLYFKSKTELLEALGLKVRSEILVAIDPILATPLPTRDLLEPLLEQVEKVTSSYKDVIHLLSSEALFFTDLPDTQGHVQVLRDRLERERQSGLVSTDLNPVVAAGLLDALMGRIVRGRLTARSDVEAKAYREQALRLMRHLLEP
ncbi:MAG: TetR/AcrR family transcriptional regulator [Trueperaceae bacterium]